MIRQLILLMVCGLALAPISIQAQSPIIMRSSAQCDLSTLSDVMENSRQRVLPIAQELVNEGMIMKYGILRHWWGDEWNMETVVVAVDEAAVIAANDEMNSRYTELYPDDDTYVTNCPRHRDVFYRGIVGTSGDSDGADGIGDAYAVSYYECDFTRIGDIAEQDRENIDVYQDLVDEGVLNFRASAFHSWGNEWNYISLVGADDIPAVLVGLEEAGNRLQQRYPDRGEIVDEVCTAHKDNIYSRVMWTVDRDGD